MLSATITGTFRSNSCKVRYRFLSRFVASTIFITTSLSFSILTATSSALDVGFRVYVPGASMIAGRKPSSFVYPWVNSTVVPG